jgi:hypothetical protein
MGWSVIIPMYYRNPALIKSTSKLPGFAENIWVPIEGKGYQVQFLQPISDIHLRSKYDYEFPGNGDLGYLKYLGIGLHDYSDC